ncbi:hypothetical protein DM860_008973 [Cuscuta australis]|uniref:Serine/arginine repetitive matrix protein 1-like n=1 Tax=Cuscuta australis TaxID=267555 RepID=A0A328DBX5_9ASTE|nr:hypothetical protein DM860_008973 [Cuscuta australis]
MGCCVSTRRSPAGPSSPDPVKIDRSAPPVEEETVKEVVLSETHISKPISLPDEEKQEKIGNGELKDVDFEKGKVEVPGGRRRGGVVKEEEEEVAVSEPSEMCSFTESISTTATEWRDDDGEVNQRSPAPPRKRRGTGDLAGRIDRSFRSPAGRSTPSPEKRNALASSRGGQSRSRVTSQRRNAGPQKDVPRDSATTRRSRSPATRREVDSRRNVSNKSPAVGEGGRSPARSAERHTGDDKSETRNAGAAEETGESLENPLVSLECFIFL